MDVAAFRQTLTASSTSALLTTDTPLHRSLGFVVHGETNDSGEQAANRKRPHKLSQVRLLQMRLQNTRKEEASER